MFRIFRGRLGYLIVSVVIVGGVFFAGYKTGENRSATVAIPANIQNPSEGEPDNVDFSSFWKAWNVLNEKYVATKVATTSEPVTDQDKVWGAISGLASSLGDPYTVFFPPKESKIFASEISGTFEGVGMEIGIKSGILTVVAPLKDTPADRAGIESGDQILKIDDISTAGMSTDEAVQKIRGPRGTKVDLTVARSGKSEPFVISIVRDVIDIPTIDTQFKVSTSSDVASSDGSGLRQDGVFVIKLYSFTAQSPSLFRDALRKFIESGSNRLILDLRGNPGGYLEAAVDMASWFLPAGKPVVIEEYSKEEGEQVYRSRGYDVFNGSLKMAILVNNGSASASEILSGALQEYGIAKLVGTKTFGKGSVQELVNITPDTSLKVTIARWLTPNGRSISEEGLDPDYVVEVSQDDLTKGRDPQMDKAVSLLLGK